MQRMLVRAQQNNLIVTIRDGKVFKNTMK